MQLSTFKWPKQSSKELGRSTGYNMSNQHLLLWLVRFFSHFLKVHKRDKTNCYTNELPLYLLNSCLCATVEIAFVTAVSLWPSCSSLNLWSSQVKLKQDAQNIVEETQVYYRVMGTLKAEGGQGPKGPLQQPTSIDELKTISYSPWSTQLPRACFPVWEIDNLIPNVSWRRV